MSGSDLIIYVLKRSEGLQAEADTLLLALKKYLQCCSNDHMTKNGEWVSEPPGHCQQGHENQSSS